MGRRGITGGLIGIALAGAAIPATAGRAAGDAPSGLAKASSISVRISPQAILPLPAQLLGALKSLPDACGAVSLVQNAATSTTTVALDSASTTGTLTDGATDLASGQAASEAVSVNLAGLGAVLANLENVLGGDISCVTNALPSTSALPVSLQQSIASLQQQLAGVTAPLRSLLGQLQPATALNRTLQVSLDQKPQADDALALNGPLALSLNLAPFDAVAVSGAGAARWNVAGGPQLEAHNTTTNLNIGQSLSLTGGSAAPLLSGVESSLTQDIASIGSALTALGQSQPVSVVCGNATIAQLPACAALQGQGASQATQTLESALSTAQSAAQSILDALSPLQGVLAQLPGIDLSGLINTAGVTSSALTQPQRDGVHSLATSSFADLKLLQLVTAQVASQLGVPADTPLIELKGLSSSSEAFVNGSDTSAPTGTSSVAEVDVLGRCVAGSDSGCPVVIPGTNITQTIATPAGDLTAVVAWGTSQTVNNTPARKTVNASALHVQLINGDAQGNNQIAALGAPQAKDIVTADVAATQVDDSLTPITANLVNASPPETGMPGPIALIAVAILGIAALGLRVAGRQQRNRR